MKVATLPKEKMKYNESDISEAKDALKLFKTKIGGSSMNGNIGVNKTISSSNSSKQNNANSNYRKPFKPSFSNEEEDSNPIQLDSKKKLQVPRTQMNKPTNLNSKQMVKTTPVKEVEDERPAFVQGSNNQKYFKI